ncbi:MAG: hypothetical protein AUG75_00150, partial [Cyanobacteria bacterium 13_1_20CM_4_61_6]
PARHILPKVTNPTGNLGNRILSSLPIQDYDRIASHLERIDLGSMEVLYDAQQPLEYVYFPESAIVSLLSVVTDGKAMETAMVGSEGMVGLPVFHGVAMPNERALVQTDGSAMRMRASAFVAAVEGCGDLQRLVHRFAEARTTLTSQSSACDRTHSVVQRCARWLLLTHDRAQSDEFGVTHQFLSQMLGVRRSSVTVAAESLRTAGAIEYTRGRVRVIDRERLEALSCECYPLIRAAYDRLLAAEKRPGATSDDAVEAGEMTKPVALLRGDLPTTAAINAFSAEVRALTTRASAMEKQPASTAESEQLRQFAADMAVLAARLQTAEEEIRAQVEALEELRYALELRHQERRQLMDGLPDALLETDRNGTICELNRAAEALLGRPRHYLLGKPFIAVVDEPDRYAIRRMLNDLDGDAVPGRWSGRVMKRDG